MCAPGGSRSPPLISEGLEGTEFVFIAVGTPSGVDGEADLRYVAAAARAIAENMKAPLIIINKSTVPVGTGDWVADIVRSHQPHADSHLRSFPARSSCAKARRSVISCSRTARCWARLDTEAAEKVAQLHLPLRAPIVITDLRTAEMIKYASNAFLATKISFINEIANICEALGRRC